MGISNLILAEKDVDLESRKGLVDDILLTYTLDKYKPRWRDDEKGGGGPAARGGAGPLTDVAKGRIDIFPITRT